MTKEGISRAASAGVAVVKTVLFTVIVPGTVTVLAPYWLLRYGDAGSLPLGPLRILGVPPTLFGAFAYFRCARDFAVTGLGTPAPIDPPRDLVARGLYRYVRNPMYVGVLAMLLGEALFFASRRLLLYAAAISAAFHLFVVLYEEPALRRKFGESYRRYLETVPRWVPRRIR